MKIYVKSARMIGWSSAYLVVGRAGKPICRGDQTGNGAG